MVLNSDGLAMVGWVRDKKRTHFGLGNANNVQKILRDIFVKSISGWVFNLWYKVNPRLHL